MKERTVRRNLGVLLVLVMLFAMSFGSIISAQGTNPGNMFSNSSEKVDVLVGFHGPPNRGLVERFGGEVYREFSIVNAIAVSLPQQAISALARNPAVSYVEPDGLVYATSQEVPWGIDRVFGNETYSFDTWDTSRGSGIGVAVLDTGIDTSHQDLNVAGGRRFYMVTTGPPGQRGLREDNNYNDVNGHGTHVAGTIAALDNEEGVVGVAPEVDLYAVKVLGDNGSGHISAIVGGIEWAVEKDIPIINMSLGSSSHSQTLKNACDNAYQKGHLLVSSAGNSGNSEGTGENVGYPAKYSSVIAVAASNGSDQRAWFSSTGPDVELIAPGVGVLSTVPGGYTTYNGTSMASPHVAGTAALVWAADSGLSNVEVRDLLKNSAENLGLLKSHQGYGMVRADLTVAVAAETDPTIKHTLTVAVNGSGTTNPGPGEYVLAEGTEVNLKAIPDNGYVFEKWVIDDQEEIFNIEIKVTMKDDIIATAYFKSGTTDPCSYTIMASAAANGTITPSGNVNVIKGENQTFIITPDDGYRTSAVTVDGDSVTLVDGEYIFTNVQAHHTIHAEFEPNSEVQPPIKLNIEIISPENDSKYQWNSWVDIIVKVTDQNAAAVAGAGVRISIDGVSSYEGTTDLSGIYTARYRIANRSEVRSYTITALASKDGIYSEEASVTIIVTGR